MKIVDVTPINVNQETLFCIKDIHNPGFQNKSGWFLKRYEEGLRIKILKNDDDKPVAFIEYTPGEFSWRPVKADGYMFIHCLFLYPNKNKGKGSGSLLLEICEQDSRSSSMQGVCTMSSSGSWMADKRLFEKNEYHQVDSKGRFELMVKKFNPMAQSPEIIDWTSELKKYRGWNLVYSDQCPWHEKAVRAISETASEYNLDLKIKKLDSAAQARRAPSGFGTFSLIHDGILLEDHYISQTRFRNILNKELN